MSFADLASGNFARGLESLASNDDWSDDDRSLSGPFRLAFPKSAGWGEGVLLASLLKRHAVHNGTCVCVTGSGPLCSILKHDESFEVASDVEDAQFRSPLAILSHALIGDLLSFRFVSLSHERNASSPHSSPKTGLAWQSVDKRGPIASKSLPCECLLDTLSKISNPYIVSVQRRIDARDKSIIETRYSGRCCFVDDEILDGEDQWKALTTIAALDLMVTISTTTAHLAAAIGIPVVLLAAERRGPQWFWPAQAQHGKVFYPSVKPIIGATATAQWWAHCLPKAALAAEALVDR